MLVSHILSNSFLKDTSQAKFFRIILVLIVYLICSGNRNAHLYELKFANHMIFFPFSREATYTGLGNTFIQLRKHSVILFSV